LSTAAGGVDSRRATDHPAGKETAMSRPTQAKHGKDSFLATIFLSHDRSKTLGEIGEHLGN
jgi:hypothetical protein